MNDAGKGLQQIKVASRKGKDRLAERNIDIRQRNNVNVCTAQPVSEVIDIRIAEYLKILRLFEARKTHRFYQYFLGEHDAEAIRKHHRLDSHFAYVIRLECYCSWPTGAFMPQKYQP